MRIYLETSVINVLFDEKQKEMKEKTEKFFELAKKRDYTLLVSDLVYTEIQRAPLEKRQKIKKILSDLRPERLDTTNEVLDLSNEYVKANLIPKSYRADAIHIAIAVTYEVDIIVSWNLRHIVRLKTIMGVNEINKKLEYPFILIVTPEEVIEWED